MYCLLHLKNRTCNTKFIYLFILKINLIDSTCMPITIESLSTHEQII